MKTYTIKKYIAGYEYIRKAPDSPTAIIRFDSCKFKASYRGLPYRIELWEDDRLIDEFEIK